MALIDMLTDIKSFNYDSVGKQHLGSKEGGDYFGDEHATGFTPNRQRPNPSEFKGVSPTTFNQTGEMYGMSGVSFPGPLNWFDKSSVHQIGYSLGRTTDNLPSEFIGVSEDGFTQTGTMYEMGDYNFSGQVNPGLSFNEDIHATGFTSGRTTDKLPSEFVGVEAGVFERHNKIHYNTLFDKDSLHSWPVPGHFPSIFKGAEVEGIWSQTGTKYRVGGYNFAGQSTAGTDYDPASNIHATGFTAGRITANLPSEFIGIESAAEPVSGLAGFAQTGTKYEMGGYNFEGQSTKGLSFNTSIHAIGFVSHVTIGDPSTPEGMLDVSTHYILGSGNDFNYPLEHSPRPVVNYFDRGQGETAIHSTGFTAGRITANLPSEFVGLTSEGFAQTGTKYGVGGYNFAGQSTAGTDYDPASNIHATGFTAGRTQKDLGPGLGVSGFHTVEDGGQAGEYIIGSSLYDEIGLTNYFDVNKTFTTGLFVKEMTTLESDFNASIDDTFQFNMFGLINVDYNRINHAIGETSDPHWGRRGAGTNLPKTSDFKGGINSPDGEEGKYHNELRISAYKEQWKNLGGNKALRGNGLGFDEPFIIKEIGDKYDTIGFGMVDGLTDIPFMAVRAVEDLARMVKWTLTPKGIVWNLKQFLLQKQNPRKETRKFNPLGTLAAVPPLLHTPRHTKGTFLDFKDPPSYDNEKANIEKRLVGLHKTEIKNEPEEGGLFAGLLSALGVGNNAFTDPKRTVDSTKGPFGHPIPMGDDRKYPNLITKQTDLRLFARGEKRPQGQSGIYFDEDTSKPFNPEQDVDLPSGIAESSAPKYSTVKETNVFNGTISEEESPNYSLGRGKVKVGTGDKLYSVGVSNTLQVPYGGKYDNMIVDGAGNTLPKDFIKFKIRDVVNGKWLIFPAHLGTITDTVTPSWTPEKYIGRPDSVHLYSGTDRSVSFDFKVAAFTKQEIPLIQEKMNYLMGLGYPTYKKVITTDDETRPVAPYIELTIGDLFNATPGYFSSISITMEETATWELDNGHQIPQHFTVGVEFVHVGKYLPTTLSKHYEVPWLKDEGVGVDKFGTFGTNDPTITENTRPLINKDENKWSATLVPAK